jgi:hypothetical protein
MRLAFPAAALILLTACPATFAPYSKPYQGSSEWEKKYLAEAQRDVYPSDARKTFSEIVIEHHYWDWIEDHSIQKAKAFLSPRGEGQFTCHAESRTLPSVDLKNAMAVAYVRPVGVKDDVLHAACIIRFYPPEWYATDVMDYGRNGDGLKVLRVPME